MKTSERYKITTVRADLGGYYCHISEHRLARNRTGHIFTKCVRWIDVGNNQRFPTRAAALDAGRAKRMELLAK